MQFCGVNSKYDIGDNVHLIKYNKDGIVTDIGILGGKLTNWLFLYHVTDKDGNNYDVTEEGFC